MEQITTRRRMRAVTGGTLGAGLASCIGAAQEGTDAAARDAVDASPLDEGGSADSWPIEDRESADLIVDRDTDDDVQSDGDIVITAAVELDGTIVAGGSTPSDCGS